jgi:uncharacterized protein
MKILAVSDVELGFIYSAGITERFNDIDLILSCGDLPYFYLEFMISMLNKPLYFVHGNHANQIEQTVAGYKNKPEGGINLHKRIVHEHGLSIAGIEGCLQYNYGPYQYSQAEMWSYVISLIPGLLINKIRTGRYLDIFVTHAPPWQIHDQNDRPHQGIKAFRWFDHVFQPSYHLHGHIHVYRNDIITSTRFEHTAVTNVYGYRKITIASITEPDRKCQTVKDLK